LCYLDAKVVIFPKQQAALDTPGSDAALQRSLLVSWAMATNVSTGVLASDSDRSALKMMLRTLRLSCRSRGQDDGRRARALPSPALVRLTSTRSAGPVLNGIDVVDMTLPRALIKDIEEAGWEVEWADRADVPQTAAARNDYDALFRDAKTATVGLFGWIVRTVVNQAVAVDPCGGDAGVAHWRHSCGICLSVWTAHRTGPGRFTALRR
jgi:hypothetical protein